MSFVNFANSIEEIFPDTTGEIPRFRALGEQFEKLYNAKPDFGVRAPGRVNIIGEHLDYSYFSVLPMSLLNDMIMVVRKVPGNTITVANTDPRFYTMKFEVPETGDVPIDSKKLEWANYFKCGVVVASRHLRSAGQPDFRCGGMEVLITGNVPCGGGLSSSAAFVVGSTLCALYSSGMEKVEKSLLQALSTTCEQLIGVNSGGMDQAASIFGEKNHALFVSFAPKFSVKVMEFAATEEPMAFLVANSMVEVVKHVMAPEQYNLRVVEVSVAASILARRLGIELPKNGNLRTGTLRGVLEGHLKTVEPTIENLGQMCEVVEQHLSPEGYTTAEAAEALGLSEEEFTKIYLTEFPVRFQKLKPYHRARHVYEEARRVLQFVDVMSSKGQPDVAEKLGELMNESHASAQTLFEHSHPDVDDLCQIARRAGAIGSRVTGAGWGGSTIHYVPQRLLEDVKKALKEEYYGRKHPNANDDAITVCIPARGTVLLKPDIFYQ